MMTQELNVCVLSAPLAAIDRRALSQAWYSALHCAAEKGRPLDRPSRNRSVKSDGSVTRPQQTLREPSPSRAWQRADASVKANVKAYKPCAGCEIDRRARRSSLARRIERKFLDRKTGTQRATFSAGGKRVHVLIQASAGRVRLLAVCPRALRETVAQALSQARFTLASRGIRCS